jgi:hypothetical protein
MNKLIYLRTQLLRQHDHTLFDDPVLGDWIGCQKLIEYAGYFTRSRTCEQLPNFDFLAPPLVPMPLASELGTLEPFEQVFDGVINRLCNEFKTHNKTIYISWSGGIDSTAILAGFLKVAGQDILERIEILCDQESVNENPYFYYKFIKDHFVEHDINNFRLNTSTVKTSILIDGEAGNQCMGSNPIAKLFFTHRPNILKQSWKDTDISELLTILDPNNPKRDNLVNYWINLVVASQEHSPVDIKTVYDFLWWANFDFKFIEVLMRKMPAYSFEFGSEDTQYIWENVLVRPFATKEVQQWSLLSKDLRAEMVSVDTKYFPKKYIFDFDKNHHYFEYKTEVGSYGAETLSKQSLTFAIDINWNKYTLQNRKDRQLLGQLLKG